MSEKPAQLIDTAIELFARDGFHNTGIDTIIREAGVTKRTLYNHFETKDALVLAALEEHHDRFVEGFAGGVLTASDEPRVQLLAVFDVAHDWFSGDKFYGCLFINVIGEYAETKSDIRTLAQAFKGHVRGFVQDIAAKAGATDPELLAKELAILLEGSIVTAQASQSSHLILI